MRPYSTRLIDLVFLSPTRPIGQPRGREDGLLPRFVPLGELDALILRPSVAHHLHKLHKLHNRRNGTIVTEYLRQEWRSRP